MSENHTPAKKQKFDETVSSKCIFCNENFDHDKKPRVNARFSSYLIVKNAASEVQDDNVLEVFNSLFDISKDEQNFSWHRDCYSSYTSKTSIKRRKAAAEKSQVEQENFDPQENKSTSDSSSQLCRKYHLSQDVRDSNDEVCIICNQKTKDKNANKATISTKTKAHELATAALSKQDEVFTRISTFCNADGILAHEIKYHPACLKTYLYKQKESPTKKTDASDVINNCFISVLSEVAPKLLKSPYELSCITNKINARIDNQNLSVNNKKVKELLIAQYGEKILFSHPINKSQSSMVFLADVSLTNLVECARQLNDPKIIISTCVDLLKKEMEAETTDFNVYVCDDYITDYNLKNFHLPSNWFLFFKKLLANKKVLNKNKHRRAKSIYQDIKYAMNNEHSPKHISLAQEIHHATRKTELVDVLSKLGHTISYSDLLNLDQLILKKLAFNQNNSFIRIPSNIIKNPSLFLHGAIDNNDFMEETLSGKNTTHVTSMVLYQENSCHAQADVHFMTKENVKNVSLDSLFSFTLEDFRITNDKPLVTSYVDINIPDESADHLSDLIWILSKLKINDSGSVERDSTGVIPNWSAFHQVISNENRPSSSVGFCNLIPHPPTKADVVFNSMKTFEALVTSIGKEYSVLTADMAIFLIAKLIQMQPENYFPKMVLRIGTFHLQKNWLHCLGQYLEGCGIEDILHKADIYEKTTVKAIFGGKHYNRGVRANKLIYESIKILQISQFFETCDNTRTLELVLATPELKSLRNSISNGNRDEQDAANILRCFNIICKKAKDSKFIELFDEFINRRCQESKLFLFLENYCKMVETLFESLKADREGDFKLHLSSTRKMLPFFFAMNHPLYARGVSLYLQDMLKLPKSVEEDLKRGMVSVKRVKGKFNGVGGDLALEQSQNKSSAIPGGLVGITRSEKLMQQWLMLYPIKSSFRESLLSYCDLNDSSDDVLSFRHHDWGISQINKDDLDVNNIIEKLKSVNLFDTKNDSKGLYNMFTGKVADEENADYLLTLSESGEIYLGEFLTERFIKKEKSVFDRLPRVIVKNFEYTSEKKNVSKTEKKLNALNEKMELQRLISVLTLRGYEFSDFASYELLDYPKALADAEGFFIKSTKSDLMHDIEQRTNCIQNVPTLSETNSKIHVFDGMCIVHLINLKNFKTFGDYAQAFFEYIIRFFDYALVQRIDLVFDRYDDPGLKYTESLLRSKDQQKSEVLINSSECEIPDVDSFMASSQNKLNLVNFLCHQAIKFVKINENQRMIISGGFNDPKSCYEIKNETFVEIKELYSNHLEADSIIFCHLHYAIEPSSEIIIHSVDTDVFILGVYFWPILKAKGYAGLWMKIPNQKQKWLACHVASETLPEAITAILPGLHAFTGCDTTSKIGTKKKVMKMVMADEESQEALKLLGCGTFADHFQFELLEKLYLKIFNKQGKTCDEARSKEISSSNGMTVDVERLPCTSDALHLHILRADLQTYIWRNSMAAQYVHLELTQYGYKRVNDILVPVFMNQSPLPGNVIMPCKCKKTCGTNNCSCKKNNVNCISLCNCDINECKNIDK